MLSFVPLLNLQEGWTKSKLGIAVYYGNIAYMLNNQLCSSSACWNQTINSLSESNINPYRITVHNFTRFAESFNNVDVKVKCMMLLSRSFDRG